MIEFPRGKSGSLKSIELSEIKDENDEPQWIQINLLSYTIIDPDAFIIEEIGKMSIWRIGIMIL